MTKILILFIIYQLSLILFQVSSILKETKIDLPEEYRAMKNDTLIGNYDSSRNKIIIRFANF